MRSMIILGFHRSLAFGALAVSGCQLDTGPQPKEPEPVVLFDCSDGNDRIRLLGRNNDYLAVEKRLDKVGAVTMETFMWDEIRSVRVTGQQGGHQSHIRFSDRLDHFILFEGSNGELADRPGETYAGATILSASDPDQPRLQISCEATELNRGVVEAVRSWEIERGRPEPQAEEPGSPFDGWF